MKIWKRVSAFLCVVVLILDLALFPIRARAAGVGALAAVAGVTVLSAYLMASGVYPYIPEAGQSLTEWTTDNLQSLLDKYNAYLISVGKSYQIVLNGATPTVKGYLTQGVIMIANDVWAKLREFVTWLQSEYALTDNQTGVELGTVATMGVLPVLTSFTAADIIANGSFVAYRTDWNSAPMYAATNTNGIYIGNVGGYMYVGGLADNAQTGNVYTVVRRYQSSGSNSVSVQSVNAGSNSAVSYKGYSLHVVHYEWSSYNDYANSEVPVYASLSDYYDVIVGATDSGKLEVDTATVSPPAALPADTPWGGLAVEGAGAAMSPAAVEDVIGSAITDRAKPVVRPVEVEIQQGTEVDAETGEVAENPVVITQDDVIPAVSELIMPGSVIDTIVSGMQTKFPFCLPFDIMRIAQAFVVPPSAPVISLTFHDPFSDSDYTISVDLSPWDEVAAVVRMLWTMLLLVGFSLNIPRIFLFNNVAATDLV